MKAEPNPADNLRVSSVQTAQRVLMGENWIEQPLPSQITNRVGPFLLIHHWQDYFHGGQEPLEVGVGPHPHRGFSPVTCIYAGALRHRDSLGNDHVVSAGGTQWMDSGSGIVHSERPDDSIAREGGMLEIIQFWVNTPRAHKMKAPSYQPLSQEETPQWNENNWRIALVQGEWNGYQSPIQSHHPMRIANLQCNEPGASIDLPMPENWSGILYVLSGAIQVSNARASGRQMMVIGTGVTSTITLAAEEDTRVLFLSSAPLEEPVVSHGPFVLSTYEDVQKAIMDYHNGKMGNLEEGS
jgi:redox-sensitive bicupin YhaK (pirin superfamily)